MATHVARLAWTGARCRFAAHALDTVAGCAGRSGAGGATLAIAQAGHAVFPGFIQRRAVDIAAKEDHHSACAVECHGNAVARRGRVDDRAHVPGRALGIELPGLVIPRRLAPDVAKDDFAPSCGIVGSTVGRAVVEIVAGGVHGPPRRDWIPLPEGAVAATAVVAEHRGLLEEELLASLIVGKDRILTRTRHACANNRRAIGPSHRAAVPLPDIVAHRVLVATWRVHIVRVVAHPGEEEDLVAGRVCDHAM